MSTDALELDEHRYWKAAISHLPTQQQRDAAWEFFVHYLAQNPKMADTFSGIILVMHANGLFMLDLTRKFHDESVAPLETVMGQFRDDAQKLILQQKEANEAIVESCEIARQVAETAAASVIKLDDAIRNGWQEVKTEKLAERIHEELETTLLDPLAAQCRKLEQATPAIHDAIAELEKSARKLRGFHFQGILAALCVSFVVITGGCLWFLIKDHEQKVDKTLRFLEQTNSHNREAFRELDRLGARIRVANAIDNRGDPIRDNYALVVESGYDVVVQDTKQGKQAAIFFRSMNSDEELQKLLREQPRR